MRAVSGSSPRLRAPATSVVLFGSHGMEYRIRAPSDWRSLRAQPA